MFANRFTAFVDACSLVSALKRNLLLTLAEGEFYRLRWSRTVLDETQRAIERILAGREDVDAAAKALQARANMEMAFEDAMVADFEAFLHVCPNLPDPGDNHVLAAALKTQAFTIVTDNLNDFPAEILAQVNMEARATDDFLADTIMLDPGRAVAAIRKMRARLKRPEITAEGLLVKMEAEGLTQTVDVLRSHVLSL
ncbi:PIN domain-containing protein [Marinivivus vitaminiproducens]|uniref:PIN domain-containing protein n=1 Tax=Marinivivus vitaminiproducens TaxID=3035935 RepID=UPI0027A204CC|nr:PIN domain-containing protein [Geminicoccaceae bacterium SCSIO 64248]